MAGLAIAAILAAAMANLSAALNSLSSTTVVDFFHARARGVKRIALAGAGAPRHRGWGVVLLPIAIRASHSQSVLETGLTIASIPSGVLLGVFLLGVLTRKPREGAAMAGVAAGLAAILYVWFATPIAFTWYVPIGARGHVFGGAGGVMVWDRRSVSVVCRARRGPRNRQTTETDRLSHTTQVKLVETI